MKPATYWVSGLPGSGKTTLCRAAERSLRNWSVPCIVVDGDLWRDVRGGRDHSYAGRWKNVAELALFCETANRLGHMAFVPTCSPNLALRENARSIITEYVEVWLDCDVDLCRSRQPEIYERADRGELSNYPGVHCDYEPDPEADLVIDGSRPSGCVWAELLRFVSERHLD